MAIIAFLAAWLVLGIAVVFVASSGGPGRARRAYLTRGDRGFRYGIPLLYIALGVAVPAVIIASRGEAVGGNGRLASTEPTPELERGKNLFRQNCATCHSLKAANANGVTGPNLDRIGLVTRQRVLNAIRIGGTGQMRMPSGILQGADAQAVAAYVSRVAGQ
jgi:cytochrome c6